MKKERCKLITLNPVTVDKLDDYNKRIILIRSPGQAQHKMD